MTLSKFKNMIPFLCIIAASIVAIVAGFIDYKNKLVEKEEQLKKEQIRSKESEKLLNKSNDILKRTEGIINDQKKVIDSSNKIIELQKELTESYKKNAALQEDFKNQVTGGNTKPILHIWSIKDGEAFYVNFDIINKGKYPLNNLKCLISDMSGIALAPFIKPERLRSGYVTPDVPKKSEQEVYREWKPEHEIVVGALNIGITFPLYVTTLPLSNTYNGHFLKYYTDIEKFYRVIVEWNNGSIDYLVTVKVENEKLLLKKVEIISPDHSIKSDDVFEFQ